MKPASDYWFALIICIHDGTVFKTRRAVCITVHDHYITGIRYVARQT